MPYNKLVPKITPRAYTIQEMEDMREAIKSIMIGEDWTDDEGTYYADEIDDKIEIEERLRTHMLCNQPPEPLIAEGKRLENWRYTKLLDHLQAEDEREKKRRESKPPKTLQECFGEEFRVMNSGRQFQEVDTTDYSGIRKKQTPDAHLWISICLGLAILITAVILGA